MSSEEKKNHWKFSELILLPPTLLFGLSARYQQWQVTTLSFVFKALPTHRFYIKKNKELQYCPWYHRPLTLLEQFDHCWSNPPCSEHLPAGSIENSDCTVRRCLLTGFFTFDVIVVNWSGCVRWGCQTWTRGGGEGSPRAWHCSSWGVRVFIYQTRFFSGRARRKGKFVYLQRTKGDCLF